MGRKVLEPKRLTADIVYGFVQRMLLSNFDEPVKTPPFHRKLWELCCSDHGQVAAAAPRNHGKSSAVSLSYAMAELLFRTSDYMLMISDTETQAGLFVSSIYTELSENKNIQKVFGIKKFRKETGTDIIVEMNDGHLFRITARGAEQRVRGFLWMHKRPNLIIVDDLEDDQGVMSKERRVKLNDWFYGAVIPCMSTYGKIRVVGTILHLDSLLESLLGDADWSTRRFEAHSPTFRTILWKERWPRHKLEKKRAEYVRRGIPEVYSREYLNWPIDDQSAFFRKQDFRELNFDLPPEPIFYAAGDLAITQKETSDYTVFVVCCLDNLNRLIVVDVLRGRWDSLQIIDRIFDIQTKYAPAIFTIESDKIQKALGPVINLEMGRRGIYINIDPRNPISDKQFRATSINSRMKSGMVYFDTTATWYPEFQTELLTFPKGKHDDQVDAFAWIGLMMDRIQTSLTQEEIIDVRYDTMVDEDRMNFGGNACQDTGY